MKEEIMCLYCIYIYTAPKVLAVLVESWLQVCTKRLIHRSQCGSSVLPKDTTTELGMLTLPLQTKHLTGGDILFGKDQYFIILS